MIALGSGGDTFVLVCAGAGLAIAALLCVLAARRRPPSDLDTLRALNRWRDR